MFRQNGDLVQRRLWEALTRWRLPRGAAAECRAAAPKGRTAAEGNAIIVEHGEPKDAELANRASIRNTPELSLARSVSPMVVSLRHAQTTPGLLSG